MTTPPWSRPLLVHRPGAQSISTLASSGPAAVARMSSVSHRGMAERRKAVASSGVMIAAREPTAVRSTQLEPARLVAPSRADGWVDKPGSRTSMGCGGAAPESKRSWLHRRQREVGHGDALGHVVEDNLDRCAEGQVTRLGVHQPGDHAQPLLLLELDLGHHVGEV